jgi:hypothetical protein
MLAISLAVKGATGMPRRCVIMRARVMRRSMSWIGVADVGSGMSQSGMMDWMLMRAVLRAFRSDTYYGQWLVRFIGESCPLEGGQCP